MGDDFPARPAGAAAVQWIQRGATAPALADRRTGRLRATAFRTVRILPRRRGDVHRAVRLFDEAAPALCRIGAVRADVRRISLRGGIRAHARRARSEEHTSELQSPV